MTVSAPSVDFMMPTYRRWPVEFVSGSGCRLVDSEGRSYLDLVAGIGVASIGHAHREVAAAVRSQAARLVHVSNLYSTRPQRALAERLARLTAGKLSFFANSGAETVECALKLARRWGGPGRTRVVATHGAFHGRTFGALSATGQPAKRAPFEPAVPGFTHVAFGDAEALAGALAEDVAAVLLEPIQGEAGIIVPPEGYLRSVRSLCDEWGALLMLDEIQTGLGRTGRWFAYEHEDVKPDVVCLAKGLGGGLPIGACLAEPEVAASFSVGDHASTFGGGPVQSSAALATLEVIASAGLVDRARAAGARLMEGLRALGAGAFEVRGRGLLIGVRLPGAIARDVAASALRKGLLVNDPTPDVIRIIPPLVISNDEIDEALSIFEDAWHENRPA